MASGTCSVEGCGKPARLRGWCGMHHQRWLRHGDLNYSAYDIRPLVDRWRDWIVVDSNGCWNWPQTNRVNGYGQAGNGRSVYMHRWVYELLVGPIERGLVIDHLCRNRACCNPAHLEPVTQAENLRRGEGNRPPVTHCKHGHEYTEANTFWAGPNHRTCRECSRISRRKSDAKRRAAKKVQGTTS